VAEVRAWFPRGYEESRARFRQDLGLVQQRWPDTRLGCHRLSGDEDLTIDWLQAEALERKERLLVLTTGEHGIEGIVGAAVLQLFVVEFLSRLEPESTGMLLAHAINPWGMKHRRRTNRANVDLNRNFVTSLDESINPDYARLKHFLNPQGPLGSLFWSNLSFFLRLLWSVTTLGMPRFRQAALLGQYRFPRGIYYGGAVRQEETGVLMDLYRSHIQAYRQIVHLDVHTGYGPRYQMSLVNSWLEPRGSDELERLFSYPLAVKADPAEFYRMQGDMIDYVYALVQNEFPERRFYAASFEFGTLGDSLAAGLRSLRTLVFENQMYWYGAKAQATRERIERDLQELYAPQEGRWRTKALADARQACEGILRAEGFLSQ